MTEFVNRLIFTICFLIGSLGHAQDAEINPVHAKGQINPSELEAGAQAKVTLNILVDAGFKAYEEKFSVKVLDPDGTSLGNLKILGGHEFFDKFSKTQRRGLKESGEIQFLIEMPLKLDPSIQNLKFEVKYQACAETYCLFPKKVNVEVPIKIKGFENQEKTKSASLMQDTFESVQSRGKPFIFFFVFLAGVLTSLTPCILPMLPITIAILGKGHAARRKRDRFGHALIYVLGMAATYSILGLLAASGGAMFGSILSHPAVQVFFAALFIGMGVSAFGFFEVQTPLFLQNKIQKLAKLPGILGIFIAGIVSGLIAGPCVGPVLVGVLTYVAQTQDMVLGFFLLFVYALGLGQLLIILGVSTHLLDRMPRNSGLMKASKIILGVALIATGLFYASLAWPKKELVYKGPVDEAVISKPKWQPYHGNILSEAAQLKKPVIIDFYADWCLACKELEINTFSDSRIIAKSENFVMVKFDATDDSAELAKLKRQYGIVGLPTILFFNSKGEWKKEKTLHEFEAADKFIERMEID